MIHNLWLISYCAITICALTLLFTKKICRPNLNELPKMSRDYLGQSLMHYSAPSWTMEGICLLDRSRQMTFGLDLESSNSEIVSLWEPNLAYLE